MSDDERIEDPEKPGQSIGADGSLGVTLDERTAPVATKLRAHMRELLLDAKTMEAQPQAVADAFETVFVALAWFEYRLGQVEARPGVDD